MLTLRNAEDWLVLKRITRFGDTDAAGVIHFYNLFRWCHEAWEESLEKYGLYASDVFPDLWSGLDDQIVLPIIHCEADFRKPIKVGDHLEVKILPEKINISTFQVRTEFECEGEKVALGLIRHLAINSKTRNRCNLPDKINFWIEASSLGQGPRPL